MAEIDRTTVRDEETIERERLRSYTAIGTALLTVVVIIVVLLFWRTCSADEGSRIARGGGGVVDVLQGMNAEPGDIAIWLMPGTDLGVVLMRYDLDPQDAVSFGEGTYVVSIGERDGDSLVERMRRDPAFFDAGFVYSE